MKKVKPAIPASSDPLRGPSYAKRGFSLVELMIAMAVFVLVAGAAFSLFGQNATLVMQQQNLSGVNIGVRNAMSQMEMDMAGGGGNLLAGVNNATPFYLSVIVNNNLPGVAAACAPNTANWSYPISSACFDSLTILSPNNSLAKPCVSAGGTQAPPLALSGGTNLAAASTVLGNDAINPANNTVDATCFKNGDEILFITPAATCDVSGVPFNFCINVVTLTQDAVVSGGQVQLQLSATGAQSSDPLGIIYKPGGVTYFTDALADNIPAFSYVVDLGTGSNAVTYAVLANPANANDPQLVRCPGTACTNANAQVVTDQVIGFKVGADLWNADKGGTTDIANYIYNAANYCSDSIAGVDCTVTPPAQFDPYDFTLVRAVRVSLIGRTTPRLDPTLHGQFLNGFDNGPYFVQQASTVVDLRNLSNVDSID